MFRLTRETRFAINRDGAPAGEVTNSHAGYPTLCGFGQYFSLRVTLRGELDAQTAYLRNIKEIDDVVRAQAIETVALAMRQNRSITTVPGLLFDQLVAAWPGASLAALELSFSPYLSVGCHAKEIPMVRLSQKFEFSAAHRLHNPALSDAENRKAFGKCNNPLGHGHNYEVQVTLRGEPHANGRLIDVKDFEQRVADTVIDRLDHKFLNSEVAEFGELIPSVENIAMVIYRLLKPAFDTDAKLASVTVWETPKTWCEYSE